jgi:hypothetical protein
MVWEDLTPRRILTPGAFRNAAASVLAVSGSINCIKHLQATAVEAGVDVDVFALFNELGARVPVLSAVAPNGTDTIAAFEAAGGARTLLKELGTLLDRDALTVTGRSIGDNIASTTNGNPDVIRPLSRQGTGSTNFPQWSPDGARIAYASMGAGWNMLDMRSPEAPQAPALQPAVAADADFWPLSWTRDGGRIAGLAVQRDGRVRGISVFDLAKQTYEAALTEPIRFGWAKWLGDNRHLVVRRERGITLLDTVTHQVRPLVSVGGYWIGESVDVSADDRWITWTETATEGDLWLAEMK